MKAYPAKAYLAALLLAGSAAFAGGAHATLLEELAATPVSKLEFGSFKLEVALNGIDDWPSPVEGVSVTYRRDPDQIEIRVAVKKVPVDDFRKACSGTIGRVREFLYVDADGTARMGRSNLGQYYRGLWKGARREAALRELDSDTVVRADVVERGSCQATLVNSPVKFAPLPSTTK